MRSTHTLVTRLGAEDKWPCSQMRQTIKGFQKLMELDQFLFEILASFGFDDLGDFFNRFDHTRR